MPDLRTMSGSRAEAIDAAARVRPIDRKSRATRASRCPLIAERGSWGKSICRDLIGLLIRCLTGFASRVPHGIDLYALFRKKSDPLPVGHSIVISGSRKLPLHLAGSQLLVPRGTDVVKGGGKTEQEMGLEGKQML